MDKSVVLLMFIIGMHNFIRHKATIGIGLAFAFVAIEGLYNFSKTETALHFALWFICMILFLVSLMVNRMLINEGIQKKVPMKERLKDLGIYLGMAVVFIIIKRII
jgi:hypothetical protein